MQNGEGAPIMGEVDREEQQALAGQRAKVEQAAKRLGEQPVEPIEEETRRKYRVFVAPIHKNARFLVKPGKLVQFRDPNSPTGTRDARRDGDVWAVFAGGVLVTDNPTIIAWCEKSTEICRDADDPRTEAWAMLKEGQVPTSTRDPLINPKLDVDQIVFRESDEPVLAGAHSHLVESARKAAAEREAREEKSQ